MLLILGLAVLNGYYSVSDNITEIKWSYYGVWLFGYLVASTGYEPKKLFAMSELRPLQQGPMPKHMVPQPAMPAAPALPETTIPEDILVVAAESRFLFRLVTMQAAL